jgi:hypothetical protein
LECGCVSVHREITDQRYRMALRCRRERGKTERRKYKIDRERWVKGTTKEQGRQERRKMCTRARDREKDATADPAGYGAVSISNIRSARC